MIVAGQGERVGFASYNPKQGQTPNAALLIFFLLLSNKSEWEEEAQHNKEKQVIHGLFQIEMLSAVMNDFN